MAVTLPLHNGSMTVTEETDIEITVYVNLGDESDAQVNEALKAAKLLEKMGFVVVVVPVTVGWDFVSYSIDTGCTPTVQVNGVTVGEGRLVKAEEIVAQALASIGGGVTANGQTVKGRRDSDGEVSVSVVAA